MKLLPKWKTRLTSEAYEFIVNQKSQQMDLFASGKAMKVA